MKAICFALLLVLSLQLQLKSHDANPLADNPLAGKTFVIFNSAVGIDKIKGTEVTFFPAAVSFKSCGNIIARYDLNLNEFKYYPASVKVTCPNLTDHILQGLFTNSKYIDLVGKRLLLKDAKKQVTVDLQQK